MKNELNPAVNRAEKAVVKQARKVVTMRRKQSLWRDLEPELNKLGRLVTSLEKAEAV